MAMLALMPLGFILNLVLQAVPAPSFPEGIFSPAEKSRIERERNINDRIKVYEKASARIQGDIQTAISKEDFRTAPETLKLWTLLLEESLKDIEANLKSKKKSRPLIRYEIQVRKAIAALQDGKLRTPVNLHDTFDSCLARARDIHKRFVEILFPQ